jgi:hypothetical protein
MAGDNTMTSDLQDWWARIKSKNIVPENRYGEEERAERPESGLCAPCPNGVKTFFDADID